MATDVFFEEYTSQDAIRKYTRGTAGTGISFLLNHDYKTVYLEALRHLPLMFKERGIQMLEFGCGGGMNLLHLMSVLRGNGIQLGSAIGTDFSPVLIDAARVEANNCLLEKERDKVEFYVAKNESLVEDLSTLPEKSKAELLGSFHFILGVNTIRYCHRAGKERECAQGLYDLLAPGGVCVVIDMNDRFPAFRSAVKGRLRGQKQNEKECYIPSLKEYTEPFVQTGFEILQSKNFCWIPHSAGPLLTSVFRVLSPILSLVAETRSMRSLVVARKPNL